MFVQTGIDVMVARCKTLDPYMRRCCSHTTEVPASTYSRPSPPHNRLIAPLGIYFPFPVQCSKLDSYLRDEEDIIYRKGEGSALCLCLSCTMRWPPSLAGFDGSLRGKPLRNELFWREWPELTARMSRDLVDLFNRIFILPPVSHTPCESHPLCHTPCESHPL